MTTFFRMARVDSEHYEEEEGIGSFRFAGGGGPHALNVARGEMAFDHYAN